MNATNELMGIQGRFSKEFQSVSVAFKRFRVFQEVSVEFEGDLCGSQGFKAL